MKHRILPALAMLFALGACLPGGTYELSPVFLPLTATTQQTVVAAVIDRRPYVLDGDESPSFLGTERANWGGEKKIKTSSGRSLAEDLSDAVVEALRNRGVAASTPQSIKGADTTDMLAAFQAQGADRLLIVEIEDWRTDVYTRVKLSWRLEAIVYDRAGNALAHSSSQGANPIASTNLKADYSVIAVEELSKQLSNLLNERVITQALR
ncbi:MAG TPA: hypothetical protein VMY41_16735 [Thermohalobaculum sp.]|nr:hypothetical protein [Thermohalobaculum sp.]